MSGHDARTIEAAAMATRCVMDTHTVCAERIERAIRALPISATPADDVGRVAEAIHQARFQFQQREPVAMLADDRDYATRLARAAIAALAPAPDATDALRVALRGLLSYVDSNTCEHEGTHRGGSIWTICDECGQEWADDEGGFEPHVDAPEVSAARAALAPGARND